MQWLHALPFNHGLGNFISSLKDSLLRFSRLSDKQLAALSKVRASIEALEAAKLNEHFGTVGEKKVEMQLTCYMVVEMQSQWGTSYMHLCEDEAGRCIVYKGKSDMLGKGESGTVVATIKAHDEYDGRKQTIITRPNVLS